MSESLASPTPFSPAGARPAGTASPSRAAARRTPPLSRAFTWLQIGLFALVPPLLAATFVTASFSLEQRAEYPGLAPMLTVYAVTFALGGIAITLAAVLLAAAAGAARHERAGVRTLARMRAGIVCLEVTTGIVALMLVSAFFVPGGGPLFAPALLLLSLIGVAASRTLRLWLTHLRTTAS